MDGDLFGKVSRLGRAASDSLFMAVSGQAFDPYYVSRCLDVLFDASGGVVLLPVIASELEALRGMPLLLKFEREGAIEAVRNASLTDGANDLGMMASMVFEQSVLAGELDTERCFARFFFAVLDRAIISGRDGFMNHHRPELISAARTLLAPIAAEAARILVHRPAAKQLGLARGHANIESHTDLLSGV